MNLELAVACLIASAHAYAPIQWVSSLKRSATSRNMGFVIVPKSPVEPQQNSGLPQELTVSELTGKQSPDMIPYFSATQSQTIIWDNTDLCVEAGGDKSGDVVQINRCSGKPTQQWNWVPDAHGRYMIQLKGTSNCLNFESEGASAGVPIELRECGAKSTVSWMFQDSPDAPSEESSPNLAISFQLRHAIISLVALASVAALSLGAKFWRGRTKTCVAAASLGDVAWNANQGPGVALTTPSSTQASNIVTSGRSGVSSVVMQMGSDSIDRRTLLSGGLGMASAMAVGAQPALADQQIAASAVRETEKGCKYVTVKEGSCGIDFTGALGSCVPTEGKYAIIDYTAFLPDGKVFDTTEKQGGKPLGFQLGKNQVIPGLEDVLMEMKPGQEVQAFIPAKLAYGSKGVCADNGECLIPPNTNLKYYIKLKRVAAASG